jgi:hypothetical protein
MLTTGVFVTPDRDGPARQPEPSGCLGIIASLILLTAVLLAFSYAVLLPMDPPKCGGYYDTPFCGLGRFSATWLIVLVDGVFYVTATVTRSWQRGLEVVAWLFVPVAAVLYVLSKAN